ncbi:MAG: hypothetical protein H6562_17265 [Lewinellaceae bacterium]|nr:hypothetical protein [Lewinellaceae bacterium]
MTSITTGKNGEIWVGTWMDGLNYLDPYDGTICQYSYSPDNSTGLSSNTINALALDKDGKLWIATTNGLNCLDTKTGVFKRFLNDPNDDSSISF